MSDDVDQVLESLQNSLLEMDFDSDVSVLVLESAQSLARQIDLHDVGDQQIVRNKLVNLRDFVQSRDDSDLSGKDKTYIRNLFRQKQ